MKNTFLLIVFLFSFKGFSQHNDTQALLYNVGIGSVFGGVGVLLNKKSNQNKSQIFIQGLYKGAIGGVFVFGSKKMVYNFHKNKKTNRLWTSKLVHATGISIIENAALNKGILENWHINIGFNRIEINTKEKFKINYKVLPVALLGTIIYSSKGKFDLKKSIQTLTPVFVSNNKIDATLSKRFVNGEGIANSIIIKKDEFNDIISHELIHAYQYNESNNFNTLFNKQKRYFQKKNKFINSISNWIYMDIPSYGIFSSLYLIDNRNIKSCYFENFFENEANFYSNRYVCP